MRGSTLLQRLLLATTALALLVLPGCGAEQRSAVATTSSTTTTTIDEVAVPPLGVFGDSLAWEAEPYFRKMIGPAGNRKLEFLAVGGVAPCDLLPNIEISAQEGRIEAAVLAFGGNSLTFCMSGVAAGTEAHVARYEADVSRAIASLKAAGIRVILAAPPISRSSYEARNREAEAIGALYVRLAAADPAWVSFVDAGAAVEGPGGRYTRTLPCLRGQPCSGERVHGRRSNVVRSPDGVHFCPVLVGNAAGLVGRCPVYSSGAYRYARALAEAAANLGSPPQQAPARS